MHAPISHCLLPLPPKQPRVPQSAADFAPSCLGGEQAPEGGPYAKEGPKPKLSPRGYVTKEEELKSLHAAAQAAD